MGDTYAGRHRPGAATSAALSATPSAPPTVRLTVVRPSSAHAANTAPTRRDRRAAAAAARRRETLRRVPAALASTGLTVLALGSANSARTDAAELGATLVSAAADVRADIVEGRAAAAARLEAKARALAERQAAKKAAKEAAARAAERKALAAKKKAAAAKAKALAKAQADPKGAAAALLPEFGFGPGQMSCLVTLWHGESGWRYTAENPSSGAYGIPQSLPGSKMGTVASDWRTNPVTQIRWGLGYIRDVYGSPCNALAAWNSRYPHWY